MKSSEQGSSAWEDPVFFLAVFVGSSLLFGGLCFAFLHVLYALPLGASILIALPSGVLVSLGVLTMSQPLPPLSRWTGGWSSRQSFFSIASWYCLVAPFLAVWFALLGIQVEGPYNRHHPLPFPNQDDVEDIAFGVCLSSLVLGIASLFGIRRHGWRVILWKTLPGILASGFFGFVALLSIAMRVCRQ